MNEIERIRERVLTEFTTATAEIDASPNPDGMWCLDVEYKNRNVAVCWHPKERVYSVTDTSITESPPDKFDKTRKSYGIGPDFVYTNLDETVAKVFELLRK